MYPLFHQVNTSLRLKHLLLSVAWPGGAAKHHHTTAENTMQTNTCNCRTLQMSERNIQLKCKTRSGNNESTNMTINQFQGCLRTNTSTKTSKIVFFFRHDYQRRKSQVLLQIIPGNMFSVFLSFLAKFSSNSGDQHL